MKTVEMKRNFKTKAGFSRIVMIGPNEFGKVKIKSSLCYPAYQEGKFVEYVQNVWEETRDGANKEYLKLKKQGYTATIIE